MKSPAAGMSGERGWTFILQREGYRLMANLRHRAACDKPSSAFPADTEAQALAAALLVAGGPIARENRAFLQIVATHGSLSRDGKARLGVMARHEGIAA